MTIVITLGLHTGCIGGISRVCKNNRPTKRKQKINSFHVLIGGPLSTPLYMGQIIIANYNGRRRRPQKRVFPRHTVPGQNIFFRFFFRGWGVAATRLLRLWKGGDKSPAWSSQNLGSTEKIVGWVDDPIGRAGF